MDRSEVRTSIKLVLTEVSYLVTTERKRSFISLSNDAMAMSLSGSFDTSHALRKDKYV